MSENWFYRCMYSFMTVMACADVWIIVKGISELASR
jgi:hypothetical protein